MTAETRGLHPIAAVSEEHTHSREFPFSGYHRAMGVRLAGVGAPASLVRATYRTIAPPSPWNVLLGTTSRLSRRIARNQVNSLTSAPFIRAEGAPGLTGSGFPHCARSRLT